MVILTFEHLYLPWILRGRLIKSGWKPQGERLQMPSKEGLPKAARATSGGRAPITGHRTAEAG